PETSRFLVWRAQTSAVVSSLFDASVYLAGNVADGFAAKVDAPAGSLASSPRCGGLSVAPEPASLPNMLSVVGSGGPEDARLKANVNERTGTFVNGVGFPAPNPSWSTEAALPDATPGAAPTPEPTAPPALSTPPPDGVSRLAGTDRYGTAAAASRATFGSGVPVAYVASGASFPDALAAGSVAAKRAGPLLLVRPDGVPPDTATELARLRPEKIVVLGGTRAVPATVATALARFAPVSRLDGVDRYATAAAASRATFGSGVPVVYVASGVSFPDALAAGSVAAKRTGPLLLVRPDAVPAATATELARLQPGKIVLLGGPRAVSGAVATALARLSSGGVTRLAGADRYGTASAASAATFGSGVPVAYVASGSSFPDALAAGSIAAKRTGPLLLVRPDGVPATTATELARLNPDEIVVLGGTGRIPDSVLRALGACID
ncbi:MAG TPA: cell wall-binding repeat-containing protein, partial [Candidatus Limnocylindria bacterium]|nr:cell wall-binding repeat-containing protein [Candidatus Limnocylindria bacterium]